MLYGPLYKFRKPTFLYWGTIGRATTRSTGVRSTESEFAELAPDIADGITNKLNHNFALRSSVYYSVSLRSSVYHQKALHRWPDIKIHEICIAFLCVISRRPTFIGIPFRQANREATRNTRIWKTALAILGRASAKTAARFVCLLCLLFDCPMRTLRSKLLLGN